MAIRVLAEIPDERRERLIQVANPITPFRGQPMPLHIQLLALQRFAGNAAVTAFLSGSSRTPIVQRCGDTPCDCPSESPDLQRDDSDQTAVGDGGSTTDAGASVPGEEMPPCLDPEADYSGLDALASTDSGTSDGTVQATLQRDGDGGPTAPVRTGTTCLEPTSFARFFQGTPPASSPFAANTSYAFTVVAGRITINQNTGNSWVNRDKVTADGQRSGATRRTVAACRARFGQGDAWFESTPDQSCPAASANFSTHRASSSDECQSVIGAGLDAEGQVDAQRLLRHEAHHLLLACAIAAEGNRRLDRGASAAQVVGQVGQTDRRLQVQYDNETAHGCNAGPQASWEQRIDNPGSTWLP